ncbi:hypothetical protein BH11MYX1_BH11MYX1_12250 [soil metagenome]
MKVALLVLVSACGSPSPQDDLAALQARASDCGMNLECRTDHSVDQIAECMNRALAMGTTASAAWDGQDAAGYYSRTYVFTDDHVIKWFVAIANDFSGENMVVERKSCPGTFTAGNRGDGCGDHVGPRCVGTRLAGTVSYRRRSGWLRHPTLRIATCVTSLS